MSFRLRLIPLALIGLGAAAAAQAQSSVKLYGLLDLNVGRFQEAGAQSRWNVSNGDMSTSYIGFAGKEELGGGLAAEFAMESFFRPDSGRSGRVAIDAGTASDVFWARSAYAGLSSNTLGTLRLGRNTTTMFVSSLLFNPFGDSFGFSPTIRHYYTEELIGDSGWSNSVSYATPKFAGATVTLQGAAGEGNGVGKNFGGNVIWFGGPFGATLAYQNVKHTLDRRFNGGLTLPAGFEKQTAAQAGFSYDAGFAKFFLQYGQVKTDATVDTKAKVAQLGAKVPIGAGAALASFGYDKWENEVGASDKYKIGTLGYLYNLSKRTELYGTYMREAITALNAGNTYAVGIRHKF